MMRGRRAAPPHLKSMGSYEMFAWGDAMSLASLLQELYDVKDIRKVFESLDAAKIRSLESSLEERIADIIGRTESQRPAYLRKLAKEHPDNPRLPAFTLLLAVIAQVRVKNLLELRDFYRGALAPGAGNRATCASMHEFGSAVARVYSAEPKFPYEVFSAFGSNALYGDTDEDEDESDR